MAIAAMVSRSLGGAEGRRFVDVVDSDRETEGAGA